MFQPKKFFQPRSLSLLILGLSALLFITACYNATYQDVISSDSLPVPGAITPNASNSPLISARNSAMAASNGLTYYVAPTGNEQNDGSLEAPLGSIQQAIDLANPGDTIYVRGGRYQEKLAIRKDGTETQPIRILAYENERPIIDGNYALPPVPDSGWTYCVDETDESTCYHYTPLVVIQGHYITFAGFDIYRSSGRGLVVRDAQHVTIRKNRIHENRYAAVRMVNVDHILFEANDLWQNGNFAPYDRPPQDPTWPVTINADDAHHITYRGNRIFNNWGEGLSTGRLNAHDIVVEDNLIFDNYSAQLYVHRSANVTVQRNFIYCTNDATYWRSGKPSPGIAVNNEAQFDDKTDLVVTNTDVINNVVVGCGWNFAIWTTGGSKHLTVAHNTFVNAVSNPEADRDTIAIALLRGDHENVQFSYNIVYQREDTMAYAVDDPELKFRNNFWLQPPPPTVASPGDLVGDPQLVGPNQELIPKEVQIDWFMPRATSPAVAAGIGPSAYINQRVLTRPWP